MVGRTLHAAYGQGSGEFIWTFTPDGTRFEGAYTNSIPNGGVSYGRRASGFVSSFDQITLELAYGLGVDAVVDGFV
jgi:hypothetical protein